jgi:hypothetical protein
MILLILAIILALGVISATWVAENSAWRIAENVALVVVGLGMILVGIQRKQHWVTTIGMLAIAAAVLAFVYKNENIGSKIAVTTTAALAVVAGVTSIMIVRKKGPVEGENQIEDQDSLIDRYPSFTAMRSFESFVDDDIKQRIANAVLMVEKLHDQYPDRLALLNLKQPHLHSTPCESLLQEEIRAFAERLEGKKTMRSPFPTYKYIPKFVIDFKQLKFTKHKSGLYSKVDTNKRLQYSVSANLERDESKPYLYIVRSFLDYRSGPGHDDRGDSTVIVSSSMIESTIGVLVSRLVQYQLSPFFPITFGMGKYTLRWDSHVVQFSEHRGQMNLGEYLKMNRAKLDQDLTNSLFMQILLGLGALSCALGVVHNDLHFGNIMVMEVDHDKQYHFKHDKTHPLCINQCESTLSHPQTYPDTYAIPTNGIEITIIDFGMCTLVNNNKTYRNPGTGPWSNTDPLKDIKFVLAIFRDYSRYPFGISAGWASDKSYEEIMMHCLGHYRVPIQSTPLIYPVLYPKPIRADS